jgi:hypothetical protein
MNFEGNGAVGKTLIAIIFYIGLVACAYAQELFGKPAWEIVDVLYCRPAKLVICFFHDDPKEFCSFKPQPKLAFVIDFKKGTMTDQNDGEQSRIVGRAFGSEKVSISSVLLSNGVPIVFIGKPGEPHYETMLTSYGTGMTVTHQLECRPLKR